MKEERGLEKERFKTQIFPPLTQSSSLLGPISWHHVYRPVPWGQPPQEPALCLQGSGLAEPHHSPGTPAGGALAPSLLSPEIWNTTCACTNEKGNQTRTLNSWKKWEQQNTSPSFIVWSMFCSNRPFPQTNIYDHIIKDAEVMCVSTKPRCDNRNPTCSCMSDGQSVSPHFSQDAAPLGPAPTWKWHHRSGKRETSQTCGNFYLISGSVSRWQ